MKIKKKNLLYLLLLGLSILLLVSCKGKSQDIVEDTNPIQQEENLQQESKGEKAEDDHLQEKNHGEDSFETLLKKEEEKPVILSFWVSWEEESKEQLDILENVYKLLQGDVIFVGIHATSFDTVSREEIQEYIEEKQYSFPILLDEEGEKSQSYFIGNLPTTVFLDEKEEVVKSFTTLIKEDEILDQIEIMLNQMKQ